MTKVERIANLKSGATEFQAIGSRREKLHVHGNVAVDIGRVTLHGTKYGGQESSGEYRYTDVWLKAGGSVLVLHSLCRGRALWSDPEPMTRGWLRRNR